MKPAPLHPRSLEQTVEEIHAMLTALLSGETTWSNPEQIEAIIAHIREVHYLSVSVDQAAGLLGLKPHRIRQLIRENELRVYHSGVRVLIPYSDLEAYMERQLGAKRWEKGKTQTVKAVSTSANPTSSGSASSRLKARGVR